MKEKNTKKAKEYTLILKSKKFSIPSYFRFLQDVDQDILIDLNTKNHYIVKSNVSERTFKFFINNWINNETLIINFENYSEFDILSKEFDRNKDLTQMFNKYSLEYNNSLSLNQELHQKLQSKINKNINLTKSYKFIIQFLFRNNGINSHARFIELKKDLYRACLSDDFHLVDLLTRQEVNFENGLSFTLNENNLTAGVFFKSITTNNFFIPKQIRFQSKDYLITSISESQLKYSKGIKSIQFSEDSQLESIENHAFFGSSLEEITIPVHIKQIKTRSFSFCKQLKKVNFSKNSELNFIGDHCFSSSAIEFISIPSNLTTISEYAFAECIQLLTVLFEHNSQLQIIENNSFAFSSIQKISIPSHVTKIGEYAFTKTNNLKFVEFSKDSELISIGSFAFSCSSIEKISIPSSVVELKNGWCCSTQKLTQIEIIQSSKEQNILYYNEKYIIGKSNLKSDTYDILYFARRDIEDATIPPYIKRIESFSFQDCKTLKKIEFSIDSNIESIGQYAFYNSSLNKIKIPQHLSLIGEYSFAFCKNFNQIEFSKQSDLKIIDRYTFNQSAIKSISIPSNITKIAEHSFAFCRQLKYVEFPENCELKIIDKHAFYGSAIKCIQIPSHVIEIGDHAFSFCRNIQIIEISDRSELIKYKKNSFSVSSLKIIMSSIKLV